MATLQASRMGTLQPSRFFGVLTWLMVTACVCGEISTDAEHDDNDIPSFVLVHSMEEVKRGTVPISIMTDTEYTNDCGNLIVLDINGSRVEAEIYHHDSIHVTINGGMTNLSSKDINDLKMNLKGQELKHGRNKLVLQNSSYYHVRVFSQTLQYEQLLQTIIITKYFHLYLFAPPKIEYDKSHGRLLCHVSHTGANEYGNWIIEFYKETTEGKISVENCTKQTTLTGYYYDTDLDACILQLPNPVQLQDAGNYSCALHIRHAETDRLTTFQCQLDTCTKEVTTSHPSEIPISLITPSVLGGVFIILFVVLIPVGILLTRCRQRPPVQQDPLRNGQQDHEQDPLLAPENRPPSRPQSPGMLLQDQNPGYVSPLEDLFRAQESPFIPSNAQPSQQTLQQQRPDVNSPNSQGSSNSSLKQHPVDSASSKSSDSQSDNNLSADDEIEQDTRTEGRHGAASGGGANVSGKNKRKKRVKGGQEQEKERENSRE